jgi:hypothetical protein
MRRDSNAQSYTNERPTMTEICQKCGEEDEDRRTMYMGCFYDMAEMGLPFRIMSDEAGNHFCTLRVCKACREDWMIAIKEWFETPKIENNCDSGIYIREFGKLLQVTAEEFEIRRKKKEDDK